MSSDTPIDQPLKRAWLKATGAWITVQYDPVPGDDSDYRDTRGNRWRADELEIDTPTPRTPEQLGKLIGSCGCGVKTQDVLYHDPYCQYRLLSEQMDAQSELAALKAENERMKIDAGMAFCVYCGHRGPKGEIVNHVKSCDKHPVKGMAEALVMEKAENERLREALEFYADAGAYCCPFVSPLQQDDRCPVLKDDGAKARAALASRGREEK